MLTPKLFLLKLCFLSLFSFAQSQILEINNVSSPETFMGLEELTTDVFINSSGCAFVNNFSVQTHGGNPNQHATKSYGYFRTPDGSDFPFESGVVISSGSVFPAGNTPTNQLMNQGFSGLGDDDLNAALDIPLSRDATFVSFDFVPQVEVISFNYLMASEEYESTDQNGPFECQYGDGFAFLLEDLTTGEVTNMAVLPDGQPVSINTINNKPQCLSNPDSYVVTQNNETNYQGRTVPLVASATVIPNRTYRIKLVVADVPDDRYDTSIFLEAGSFNIGVQIVDENANVVPEEITVCEGESFNLIGEVTQSNLSFEWRKDGAVLSEFTGDTISFDNIQPEESGVYQVIATSGSCPQGFTDQVTIHVTPKPEIIQNSLIEECAARDGSDLSFDLTVNAIAGFNNLFYLNEIDALEGNPDNAISDPTNFTTNETIMIWQRVEYADFTSCYEVQGFEVIVIERPPAIDQTIELCSEDGSDQVFDLDSYVELIKDNITPNTVEFYESLEDAENETNPIQNTANYVSSSNTIYARVTDRKGCWSIASIELIVFVAPAVLDIQIELCDYDGDGLVKVNLTNYIDDIYNGQADVSINFYTTLGDAINDTNPISNPENFVTDGTTIYASVNLEALYTCKTISHISFLINPLPQIEPIPAQVNLCDDDRDGQEMFDLQLFINELIGNVSGALISIHQTQVEAENASNPIDLSTAFIANLGSTTIYVRLQGPAGCFEVHPLEINVSTPPTVSDISEVYCDADGNGNITFNLFDFVPQLLNGQSGFNVSFHYSFDGAQSNSNAIANPSNFSTSTTTIYARVSTDAPGCLDIAEINLTINPFPQSPPPISEIICDTDNDGSELIDLTAFDGILTNDNSSLTVSYHTTEEDALNNVNPIENSQNFLIEQNTIVLYARINGGINCTITHEVEITLSEVPVVNDVSPTEFCESPTGSNSVDLSTYDEWVYSGNLPVDIAYYLNQSDAIACINPITEYNAPIGESVVYARVNYNSCATLVPLRFSNNPLPPTPRAPARYVTCDTDGDGLATYHFSDIERFLVENPEDFNFTFFLSYDDAQANLNPISGPYQTSIPDESIFVKIENKATLCNMVKEVRLETNPSLSELTELAVCDDDYDGIAIFDLQLKENEIRELIGFNSTLTFHTTISDAEQGINPISDINNFVNTTANQQTIYARGYSPGRCQGIVEFDLVVNPLPEIIVDDEYLFCPQTEIEITAGGQFEEIRWIYNGEVVSNSASYTATQPGEYTIEASFTRTECIQTKTIRVNHYPSPTIVNVIVNGTTAEIIASGEGAPFEYSVDGTNFQLPGNNIFQGLRAGQYNAYARNSYGCLNTDSYQFVVIEFPNYVSPNGDGMNDELRIEGIEYLEGSRVRIFDRFGKTVINRQIDSSGFIWKADYLKRGLPTATYWYTIDLTDGRQLSGYFVVKNY